MADKANRNKRLLAQADIRNRMTPEQIDEMWARAEAEHNKKLEMERALEQASVGQTTVELPMTSVDTPVTKKEALKEAGKVVGSWQDFIKIAKKIAKQEDYPIAVLLGQAAQETGRDVGNAVGHNFFGHKGVGPAGSNNLLTWEDYGNGPVQIYANFKAYNSPEEAIRDYIKLIKNNYPAAYAARKDPERMVALIKAGGYATDPNYVENVLNTPEFREYRDAYQYKGNVKGVKTQQEKKQKWYENILDFIVPNVEAAERTLGAQKPAWMNPTSLAYQTGNQQPQQSVQRPQTYTVKGGDTLWGIAEQKLGSGNRWQELKGYTGDPRQMPIGTKIQVPTFKPKVPTPSISGPTASSNLNRVLSTPYSTARSIPTPQQPVQRQSFATPVQRQSIPIKQSFSYSKPQYMSTPKASYSKTSKTTAKLPSWTNTIKNLFGTK